MTKYPDTSFAIISDLHFYDTSLGVDGTAFEKAMLSDRKMLAASENLLDQAINDLLKSDIQFLLICGDLTKDGEALNHRRVAAKLQTLLDHGIKVFVTPGNHDINNYSAVRFKGTKKAAVASVSAAEFKNIYAQMGYQNSLISDTNSLSYVAEPLPGLWIVALDSCRYDENKATDASSVISGAISKSTEEWLTNVLHKAQAQGKAVIPFLHHGIIEHWAGQARLYPKSLVKDHTNFSTILADNQVDIVFTGHNHAQSITRAKFKEKYLYDIGTGSIVTYPCPIRYCSLQQDTLTVNTSSALPLKTTLTATAKNIIKESVAFETVANLCKYKVPPADAQYIANTLGEAFAAHYGGDADISLRAPFNLKQLSLWGKIVFALQLRYLINPLWSSSASGDNSAKIALAPPLANDNYQANQGLLLQAINLISSILPKKRASVKKGL